MRIIVVSIFLFLGIACSQISDSPIARYFPVPSTYRITVQERDEDGLISLATDFLFLKNIYIDYSDEDQIVNAVG